MCMSHTAHHTHTHTLWPFSSQFREHLSFWTLSSTLPQHPSRTHLILCKTQILVSILFTASPQASWRKTVGGVYAHLWQALGIIFSNKYQLNGSMTWPGTWQPPTIPAPGTLPLPPRSERSLWLWVAGSELVLSVSLLHWPQPGLQLPVTTRPSKNHEWCVLNSIPHGFPRAGPCFLHPLRNISTKKQKRRDIEMKGNSK